MKLRNQLISVTFPLGNHGLYSYTLHHISILVDYNISDVVDSCLHSFACASPSALYFALS